MPHQDKTVLISGAGIAGPVLGWWLNRYGFTSTIVEKAPELSVTHQLTLQCRLNSAD